MISFSGYFVKESRLTLIEDAKAYGNGTDYFDHDLAQAQKIIGSSEPLTDLKRSDSGRHHRCHCGNCFDCPQYASQKRSGKAG